MLLHCLLSIKQPGPRDLRETTSGSFAGVAESILEIPTLFQRMNDPSRGLVTRGRRTRKKSNSPVRVSPKELNAIDPLGNLSRSSGAEGKPRVQPVGWKMRKSSTSFAISASFWA